MSKGTGVITREQFDKAISVLREAGNGDEDGSYVFVPMAGSTIGGPGMPDYILPGVTLSMIARGTDISLAGISRIFNGHRTPIKNNMRRICDFLKLNEAQVNAIIRARIKERAERKFGHG